MKEKMTKFWKDKIVVTGWNTFFDKQINKLKAAIAFYELEETQRWDINKVAIKRATDTIKALEQQKKLI